jgi:LemA protein
MESQPQSKPIASPDDARVLPDGKTYSYDEVQDIYRRAGQIQSEAAFARDEGWDAATLETGANRAGISDKALLAAIKQRDREIELAAQQKVIDDAKKAQFKKYALIGGGTLAVFLVISLWTSSSTLGSANARVESARAQVDNALQRRHDMVPNLLAMTKQHLQGQEKLISALENANKNAKSANDGTEKLNAEAALSQNISQALVALQSKSGDSDVVLNTIAVMEGAENRIAQERRKYNEAVGDYNRRGSGFGPKMWHGILGYPAQHDFFKIEDAARQAPKY